MAIVKAGVGLKGVSGSFRPVRSPYSDEVIGEVETLDAAAGLAALERVTVAGRAAMATLPAYRRAEILRGTAARLAAEQPALALLIASEGGKPLKDARIEAARAVSTVMLAAEEATRLEGQAIPMDGTAAGAGRLAFTLREPIGPVFAISAFNHPLNLIAHLAAPALAAGCPILLKPASTTPLCAFRFMELARAAGLPEEALVVAPMPGAAAEAVARDPRVAFVSFIGSAAVGWHLRRVIADGTRIALEHGGTAPVIVDRSADLALAVPHLVKGGFYHAGQVCVSVQRIYAHETIATELGARIAEAAGALVVGDPTEEATDVGPIITDAERDRVAAWIDEAVAAGARVGCGARSLPHRSYAPTVLFDPPDDARVVREEAFGPVVDVLAFRTLDEAIARANGTPDAFQASVYAKDIDVALACSRRLDATAVMVNDHTAFRVDWMPFGGRGRSGLGLGGVPYSLEECTRPKLVVLRG